MSRALKAEGYPYVLHKRISRGRNKTDETEGRHDVARPRRFHRFYYRRQAQ